MDELCVCGHPAHPTGTECTGRVNHGPKHFHLCLCINLAAADKPCHPLQNCQGGQLAYGDIWHLQRGHSLQAYGKILTPSILTGDGDRVVGYRSRAYDTMLRCLRHATEGARASQDWFPVTVADVQASLLRQTCSWARCGVNVLEQPPNPVSTCMCTRTPDPGICPITHPNGLRGGGHCKCAHDGEKTPCSDPPCNTDGPCDTHEIEEAHAADDHQWCGITCEAEFTTEMLRNSILYRAIPGSANMLKELIRRARVEGRTCLDPIECPHEAATGQAEAATQRILTTVWKWIEGSNDGHGSDTGDLMYALTQGGFGPPEGVS